MPSKIYYLDDAQTQPLKVSWGWSWRNLVVAYQGQEIGQFATTKQLKQGATFILPDGRQLAVQLRTRMAQQQLELLLDGQPLPGSSTYPQEQFQQARYVLWFLAAINIVLGLIAELGQIEVLQEFGMGIGTILVGLAFLGFDWWARTRFSPWAFYVAIGLIVVDMVATVALAAGGSSGSTGGLVMRVFLVLALMRGATAAKELRAQREQALAVPEW